MADGCFIKSTLFFRTAKYHRFRDAVMGPRGMPLGRCGIYGHKILGFSAESITLRYSDGILNVAGTEVPIELDEQTRSLKLHVFLDRSVMEVFINDGRQTVTRVEYPGEDDLGVGAFAEGGKAAVKSVDVWQMKSIW